MSVSLMELPKIVQEPKNELKPEYLLARLAHKYYDLRFSGIDLEPARKICLKRCPLMILEEFEKFIGDFECVYSFCVPLGIPIEDIFPREDPISLP